MLLNAVERETAELFLNSFPRLVAEQGKLCYEKRQLGSVWLTKDGQRERLALGQINYAFHRIRVELFLQNNTWRAVCTCKRGQCLHAHAGVLAALKQFTETPKKKSNAAEKRRFTREVLRQGLQAKVGRTLRQAEERFVTAMAKVQTRIKESGHLGYTDFQGLLEYGWYVPDCEQLKSKADLDPIAFLQQFAIHCAIRNIRLPDMIQPLIDEEVIEGGIYAHRRQEEIKKWKYALTQLPASLENNLSDVVDFAVLIAPPILQLLVQATPGGPFKKTGMPALHNIIERVADGTQSVHPEALPIFNGFFGGGSDYASNSFEIDDPSTRCLLSAFFRNPTLQNRLLTENFEPFSRAENPLQWHLAETPEGDYKLRLIDSSGSPAPKDLITLPGKPFLYLGGHTVHEGPPKPKQLAVTSQRIPAPALETNEGLALLRLLKLPPPARVESRVRNIRLEVLIRCKLGILSYNDSEQCRIEFLAGSTDTGILEKYSDDGWRKAQPDKNADPEVLYLFDRSALDQIPPLADALGASWDPFEHLWRLKVTRNFPEKFLDWYQRVPRDLSFELDPELASLVRDPVKARVTLECQEVGVDWFDLRTTVNVDDTTLTAEEIKLLLNAKGKAVRLAGKGWRRLEYQLTEEEDQSLARLGLSPHDFSSEPQRLHALQLADRAGEKMLAEQQYNRIRERANEIKTRVTPELPATVTATLRPYQTDGFHFLAYLAENNFGGILADDMGLGKTLQTLTWLEWIRAKRGMPKASLVVCPKSVMENWRAEAMKFAPELKVQIWRGLDDSALARTAAENDLLVLNYAQLRSLATTAAQTSWHVVILDEAQYIKNPDSQTAQAARALRADHRIALSGTPIENRLLDLWSLMAFAMPGVLGNRADFKRRFDQQGDPFARRRLSARVRPFLLRRTKKQVAAELPDRIEEDIVCEMEGTQKSLYRAEFKRAQQLLLKVKTQAELNEFRFNFLTSLLRLRQICCHPALIDDGQRDEESAKLSALVDLLEPLMEEGYKVLVFSQFVEMLHLIRDRIRLQKWQHFYLDGSSEDRGDLVQSFQQHEGPAVFLISLKAGGFGLNLTAASYVVLYDPWWNPAVENQAIDRTHRIGQTQKVIAYRLLTKNSIEQKIRELQRQKSMLAENVLGDESFASSLTLDDLRFLFEDDPIAAEPG